MTDQHDQSGPREPEEKATMTQEDLEVEADQMLDLSGPDPETHDDSPAST